MSVVQQNYPRFTPMLVRTEAVQLRLSQLIKTILLQFSTDGMVNVFSLCWYRLVSLCNAYRIRVEMVKYVEARLLRISIPESNIKISIIGTINYISKWQMCILVR